MKNIITLEDILLKHSAHLGIREISSKDGLKAGVSRLSVKRYSRITHTLRKKRNQSIIILNVPMCERLFSKGEDESRKYFNQWNSSSCVCFIVSQTNQIPLALKKIAQNTGILFVASSINEHFLESLLMGIIKEQLYRSIAIHGVAIEEVHGKGVLITGASGVGKTTAALACIQKGHYWIADDLVVITKGRDENLIVRGHKKIRHFFHTSAKGIIPVSRVLPENKIKSTTKLAAIIEVIRNDANPASLGMSQRKILGVDLPCCCLSISSSGYFTENLLEEALRCIEGWYT